MYLETYYNPQLGCVTMDKTHKNKIVRIVNN
jgi:hypothetical protein